MAPSKLVFLLVMSMADSFAADMVFPVDLSFVENFATFYASVDFTNTLLLLHLLCNIIGCLTLRK